MSQPELPTSIEDLKNLLESLGTFLPAEYQQVIDEAIGGIENGSGNPEETKQKLQQLLQSLMGGGPS